MKTVAAAAFIFAALAYWASDDLAAWIANIPPSPVIECR